MKKIELVAHVESKHIPIEGKLKLTVKSKSNFPITVRGYTISSDSKGRSFSNSDVFNIGGYSFVTFTSAENTIVSYQIE